MIAGLVVSVMAVAGIVAAVMHEIRLFTGFRDIAPEVKTIANHLRGEVLRDRHDLVVSGQFKGIPTVVRFCKQPNAPAMGLYVRIPAPFQLSLIPKQIAGSSLVSNVKFKSRVMEDNLVARSMNPADLESLLAADRTVKLLESLCCSTKTIFELNRGRLELLEMALPEELTRHVLDHLAMIRDFSDVLAAMPGSDQVKVRPLERRNKSWFFKAAVAVGVAVVAVSVIATTKEHGKLQVFSATDSELVHGVPATDASVIDGMDPWRAAKPDEVNTQFANWLQDSGQKPATRIEFNPLGSESSRGVAYLLVREDGARRLVVLVDHREVFDACFSRIDGIALVPVTSFPKLKWGPLQAPTQKPNGDAILVVRDASDPRSAELLFFPNGTLFSGVPRDYASIDLQRIN
jgi:hypothetical protein